MNTGLLTGCRVCGELVALHTRPCDPGVCVSAGCAGMIVDDALAVCALHLAVVKAQLSSRPADGRRYP